MKKLENLITENMVDSFMSEIELIFPNFVAGVLCDNHGFPIASKVPKNFHIRENELALSAIAGKRTIINDPRFMKVKRAVDKGKNVRLLLLLEKSNSYINRFKELRKIIDAQDLF